MNRRICHLKLFPPELHFLTLELDHNPHTKTVIHRGPQRCFACLGWQSRVGLLTVLRHDHCPHLTFCWSYENVTLSYPVASFPPTYIYVYTSVCVSICNCSCLLSVLSVMLKLLFLALFWFSVFLQCVESCSNQLKISEQIFNNITMFPSRFGVIEGRLVM